VILESKGISAYCSEKCVCDDSMENLVNED
jgi:hypothetical protein